MYFHGTNIGGLTELIPKKSNEGEYVYLAKERERVLPYLVNPYQKFYDKKYGEGKAVVGFRASWHNVENGIVVFEEPYPNYFAENFKGAKGYIYSFANINNVKKLPKVGVYGVATPIQVESVETIDDVYKELTKLANEGKIKLIPYENTSKEFKEYAKNIFLSLYTNFNKYQIIKEYLEECYPFYSEIIEKAKKN